MTPAVRQFLMREAEWFDHGSTNEVAGSDLLLNAVGTEFIRRYYHSGTEPLEMKWVRSEEERNLLAPQLERVRSRLVNAMPKMVPAELAAVLAEIEVRDLARG